MNWRRSAAALLAAGLLLLPLPACGDAAQEPPAGSAPAAPSEPAEAPPEPPGEEVVERVVSLNPSVTEILLDMDLGGLLVGVGTYDDAPADLARCGTEIQPDVDAVAGADAQLVLALAPLPAAAAERLGDAGVAVAVLDKPDDPEAFPDYYEEIASAVLGDGGEDAARAFAAPLMDVYDAVRDAVGALDEESRPLGAFAAFLPLTLATGDTLQGRLLETCGVRNAAADYGDWRYPEELLLPLNPDLLVVDARTASADDVRAHPNYKTTPCVTQERILEVDGAAIENAGRRFFETMLAVARLAHPDADLPELGGVGLPGADGADEDGEAPI